MTLAQNVKSKKALPTLQGTVHLVTLGNNALACTKGLTLPKGMTLKDLINAGRKR
jgi:hypothetical protein